MEKIKFQCSACKKAVNAPANMAGKTGKCPSCGATIAISVVAVPPPLPVEQERKQPAKLEEHPASITITCVNCHRVAYAAEQLAGKTVRCSGCGQPLAVSDDSASAKRSVTLACPQCASPLQLTPQLAGKTARCNKCQTLLMIFADPLRVIAVAESSLPAAGVEPAQPPPNTDAVPGTRATCVEAGTKQPSGSPQAADGSSTATASGLAGIASIHSASRLARRAQAYGVRTRVVCVVSPLGSTRLLSRPSESAIWRSSKPSVAMSDTCTEAERLLQSVSYVEGTVRESFLVRYGWAPSRIPSVRGLVDGTTQTEFSRALSDCARTADEKSKAILSVPTVIKVICGCAVVLFIFVAATAGAAVSFWVSVVAAGLGSGLAASAGCGMCRALYRTMRTAERIRDRWREAAGASCEAEIKQSDEITRTILARQLDSWRQLLAPMQQAERALVTKGDKYAPPGAILPGGSGNPRRRSRRASAWGATSSVPSCQQVTTPVSVFPQSCRSQATAV